MDIKKFIYLNLFVFLSIFIISTIFSPFILSIFGHNIKLYTFGIGDAFSTLLTVSFYTTLTIYIPLAIIIFYGYFRDALFENEKKIFKKYLIPIFLLIPLGLFIGFQMAGLSVILGKGIANYLGLELYQSAKELFLINLTIIFGTIMCLESFPILKILIDIGIVKRETLKKFRIWIYVIFYILVALLTPGDYFIGNLLLFSLLVFLFEITIRL